ncbi:hypothetical protein [Photobacterium indicum]|uniref:Uncharacterized protein n=1 Tax=Photobacterium indicum TaxID=81447 RepID=A0A2T3LEP8_9GAMM|nr:hypothetical protein [Photobacterium indicum]PSV49857.1 hypothetical protein C9J47_04715 [Photobacterium indicum]
MEIQLLKSICLGIPTMFIAMVMYIYLLLGIAKVFSGAMKFMLSMMLFLVFSGVVVSPMFYLISSNQPAIQESTYTLVAVLLSYFAIMTPAVYYLVKVRIKELQRAGYFLPRR